MDNRPRPAFSANELRASLGMPDAIENDPDAMTAVEIADATDCPINTVRRYLKIAVADGSWISVGRQRRKKPDGWMYYAEGYKQAEG